MRGRMGRRPVRGGNSTRGNGRNRPETVEAEEVEVLPPSKAMPNGTSPSVYADIAAQINQYTDRPDLLLETIEKHDPGFIAAMNAEAKEFAKKSRQSKFNFGRVQAYTSLVVAVIAALAILGGLLYTLIQGTGTLWVIIGLAIFFAISQSGLSGFLKIAHSISKAVASIKHNK